MSAVVSAVWTRLVLNPSQESERRRMAISEHGDGADGRAFRRREDAAVDAADDDERDDQHRPDGKKRLSPLDGVQSTDAAARDRGCGARSRQ